MAVTYADHADRAMRAAAIVLTQPPPQPGPDLDAVRRLHDDVTTTLAEATRLLWTGALGEPRSERERAGVPAAHELLTELEAYPRLAQPSTASESPTQRWAARPTDLGADLSAVEAWKVLAAESFLARACIDQLEPRITTPVRAHMLTHQALAADALATATADLARAADLPVGDVLLARSGALATASAHVQRDIADVSRDRGPVAPPLVPATRERLSVQLVTHHRDVAPALANLARLTDTGHSRAAELFATATMLATMADAAATTMDTALRSPRLRDPEALHEPIRALSTYRRELTNLVRTHQPKLASLDRGNPAALAQARELRTSGVPRIQALSSDPHNAAGAVRELQCVAGALAPATAALRAGVADLSTGGELLTYSLTEKSSFNWRTATEADALPVLDDLDAATRTADSLRPKAMPSTTTPHNQPAERVAAPADRAGIVDLTAAIDRRRTELTTATGRAAKGLVEVRCAAPASLQPSHTTVFDTPAVT